MDKKTFGIGVLSITSLLLVIACMMAGPKADAAFAVKDRDYQLLTVANQKGGDSIYVVDNRTGMMAVFTYDATAHLLRPKQVRPVSLLFER